MPLITAANGPFLSLSLNFSLFLFLICNEIQVSNESNMACQLKLSVCLSVYHIYLSTVFIFLCEV